MLKFLRKIRKKLLNEGSLKRYLLYAVGEIILVVVGILIALQLNNWNQKRLNKKLEIQYYLNMKDQMNKDLNTIYNEINYNQILLNQFSYAKSLLMQKDVSKMDTLGKIVLRMIDYADFRRKSNVYLTLVNSGEIKYINNYKIIEGLQSLEENYSYINRIEDTHLKAILFQVVPEIKQVIKINPIKVENIKILFSYHFQNGIDLLIHLMEEKKEAYNKAIKEISLVTVFIDQELGLDNINKLK